MRVDDERLSAFLDGELTPDETTAIEVALAADPELQTRLEGLMAADDVAKEEFAAMAAEPVPLSLAAAIKDAPAPRPANRPAAPSSRRGFLTASAVVLALALGGASGFFLAQTPGQDVASARTWLTDIAEYHAIYSRQVRHLVEVPADEADHIETWLTGTLGAEVRIPDLEEHGLTFAGARLLVAIGRPVAQLVYTDAEGRVVALCQITSETPNTTFENHSIGEFDMIAWGGTDANFVVVADQGREALSDIARTAAEQV